MERCKIYIVVAGMLALTACSDDYFNRDVDQGYSEYIGYSINVTGSDEFQARSSSGSLNSAQRLTIDPTGASIGGRQLYLHTEVVDSIPQTVASAKSSGSDTPSRGTVVMNPTDIGVSAIVFDGETNAWPNAGNTYEAQMYMHNEKLQSPWQTNRYWPRENDWIRFYAYSPYGALDETTYDNTAGLPTISTAEPSFAYTVNGTISEQEDLLVGSEQYIGGWCSTAQLDLCHALTAVRIHIAGSVDRFTLESVTLSGLKNHGTYTYNYNESAPSDGNSKEQTHDAGDWSDVGYKGDGESASYTVFSGSRVLDGTGGKDVNGTDNVKFFDEDDIGSYVDATPGDMVLLMMPQELTADAKITITGRDDVLGKEGVVLSATIGADDGSKEWVKGKMVTYTLTFSSTKIDYVLKVTTDTVAENQPVNPASIEYYGSKEKPIYVQSYKRLVTSGGTSYEAVPWRALISDQSVADGYREFDLDNDWLVLDDVEGKGKVVKKDNQYQLWNETRHYTMFATEPENSYSHDKLKGRTLSDASVAAPWDLSRNAVYDGSEPENTANSYVIGAPGYYTLPLVYGNAITASSDNTGAYRVGWGYKESDISVDLLDTSNATVIGTAKYTIEVLPDFKDHAGTTITNPWIVKGKGGIHSSARYTASGAKVVWMDEPCLITDVSLNETEDYITFRVRDDNICEGNAVIAVTDENGDIMWSWHIWVADGVARYDIATDDSGPKYYSIESDNLTLIPRQLKNRRVTSEKWIGYDASLASPQETPVAGTYTEHMFSILCAALGHCDGEAKTYTARNRKILFEQYEAETTPADGDQSQLLKSVEVTFTQNGGTSVTKDNVPYYQYGRKDPMLPAKDGNSSNKPHYDNDWTQSTELKKGNPTDLAGAIKHPDTYFMAKRVSNTVDSEANNYCLCYNWCSEPSANYPYSNLWNAQSGDVPGFSFNYTVNTYGYFLWFKKLAASSVTKTVYDPCPPGYELPRFDAFTGASYDGMNVYPYYYDKSSNTKNFVDYYLNEADNDIGYSLNKQANLWLPPVGYYQNTDNWLAGTGVATAYNGISIYCETMDRVGACGTGTDSGGDLLFVQFLGHRTGAGIVNEYGRYASALTCTPSCLQWRPSGVSSTAEKFLRYELLRLCIIRPYTLRTQSTSAFDLAFPIMPARTGCNPSTTVVDAINPDWSGNGNDGDYNIGF